MNHNLGAGTLLHHRIEYFRLYSALISIYQSVAPVFYVFTAPRLAYRIRRALFLSLSKDIVFLYASSLFPIVLYKSVYTYHTGGRKSDYPLCK